MKKLSSLLKDTEVLQFMGDAALQVTGICSDSRKVVKGDLFVAVRGYNVDGHAYIEKAYEAGAVACVAEHVPDQFDSLKTIIIVKDASVALGTISSSYYDNPSRDLRLVGITGTNGKTTVATLCFELFSALGYMTGLLSTIENRIGSNTFKATHTTPGPEQINKLLRDMADAGCAYAFMEVSSHAAHQNRIAGLQYSGGVFTNITHDHLDYHKTFINYINAKKMFFDGLPKSAFALVNKDDKHSGVMLQNTAARAQTFSIKSEADFSCRIISNGIEGLVLDIQGQEFHSSLHGSFNASNLLVVYAVAYLLGEDSKEVLQQLSSLGNVRGRFEVVRTPESEITGVIDYAHTPDAVAKILSAIQELLLPGQRIITVMGCGGDRDASKRPIMASTGAKLSSQLVLTSDNPRTENPESILSDMEAGLTEAQKDQTLVISDRKSAIKTAVKLAKPGDIILVAGKGHENYQEINGVRHHFDDREVLSEILKNKSN